MPDNGGNPLKLVGMQQASLEDCVQTAQHERVLLTRRGRPVALVVGVAGLDLEQIELGQSDEFWTLIGERRGQKTLTRAELDNRLAKKESQKRRQLSKPSKNRTNP